MSHALEKAFHDMVLGESDAPLELFLVEGKAPLHEVMDIYRRNMLQSVALHLVATFPVCEALVGERYFRQLCRGFIQAHPPTEGALHLYGGELSAYIAQHEVSAHVPYLADMAKLEWARHQAAWAKEVPVLIAQDFQVLPAETHGALLLKLHLSFQVLVSDYAVDSIWEMHQEDTEPHAINVRSSQSVLVWRKQGRVMQQRVGAGVVAFYRAVQQGKMLEVALQAACEADGLMEPSACMVHVLSEATVVRW